MTLQKLLIDDDGGCFYDITLVEIAVLNGHPQFQIGSFSPKKINGFHVIGKRTFNGTTVIIVGQKWKTAIIVKAAKIEELVLLRKWTPGIKIHHDVVVIWIHLTVAEQSVERRHGVRRTQTQVAITILVFHLQLEHLLSTPTGKAYSGIFQLWRVRE